MENRYRELFECFAPAGCLSAAEAASLEGQQTLDQVSVWVAGPVLTAFVWWVLLEAERQKIKRLYFLARDGWVFYQIAQRFQEKYRFPVECRYLIGSRIAWRTAAYGLEGEDACQTVTEGGYCVTLKTVLQRSGLPQEIQQEVLDQLVGEETEKWDRPLSKTELYQWRERLKENPLFQKELKRVSQEKREACLGYFRQEGLLEPQKWALVDSGWTGSMQKTLSLLLKEETGFSEIQGFYFGLFQRPPAEGGLYKSWYLEPQSSASRVLLFNNNLFECLCAAPFGMALSYCREGENYRPVFDEQKLEEQGKWSVSRQLEGILRFTEAFLLQIQERGDFQREQWLLFSEKLLQELMWRPSLAEAELYGDCPFSDDMSQAGVRGLGEKLTEKQSREYLLLPRFLQKAFGKGEGRADSFWLAGSLRRSHLSHTKWIHWNALCWEFLRYLGRKLRSYR